MGTKPRYTAVMNEQNEPDDLPEYSYVDNLYAMLNDFYFYATHMDEEDGRWHRDEQSEAFADRVMAFIDEELKRSL